MFDPDVSTISEHITNLCVVMVTFNEGPTYPYSQDDTYATWIPSPINDPEPEPNDVMFVHDATANPPQIAQSILYHFDTVIRRQPYMSLASQYDAIMAITRHLTSLCGKDEPGHASLVGANKTFDLRVVGSIPTNILAHINTFSLNSAPGI